MVKYKNKACLLCGDVYTPNSPKQKYCPLCKEEGRKIADRERDLKRYRKNNKYQEYSRCCKSCGKEFKTHYSKKIYCGSKMCEAERLCLKNKRIHKKRDKEYLREKATKRYYNKRKTILKQKADYYRKFYTTTKEYEFGKTNKLSYDYVNNYIEERGYKLLSKEYINSNTKLKLLCPDNHEWEVIFKNFMDKTTKGGLVISGVRCMRCYIENNYISKPEQMLREFFEAYYPDIVLVYNDREQIKPKELDLYFPDHKVAIEVCGLYWHSEVNNVDKAYHYNKMMACYNKGIRLITVFEDELYNSYEVVISRLLQALGLNDTKVYARNCIIKEVSGKEANRFFDNYHIQGKSTALKAWGLFYKERLVSVCSVGNIIRKHTSTEDTIELKRFCTVPGLNIVGGASKLFKQVVLYSIDNNYKLIKSYCDMRYSNIFNPIYEKLGFNVLSYTKYTPHYVKGGKRYRNFSLRKTPSERLTGKTEHELRQEQGIFRIWDCGHRTYIYNV